MSETTDEFLLALNLKLPSHTYRAVKLRAEELEEEERRAFLERVLSEQERSEGAAG